MLLRRFLPLLLSCSMAIGVAHAEEHILSYDAQVSIKQDGSLDVVETIRVRAEGDQIQRGIYRDFPTDYHDARGHHYRVGFELVGIRRDGQPEPHHTESMPNGVRIYIGSADMLLDSGEYAYELHYRTTRQLGFFADHDELYWNVTGNGWVFPISSARATLRLPAAVPSAQLRASGYTGPQGSMQRDLTAQPLDGGATYGTTQMLGPYEGLSVVLEFPKGVIREPDPKQKLAWFLDDNLHMVIGLGGLALLWAFYLYRWHVLGRDPDRGVRIPLYQPPAGYSAASLRFVRRMGYDDECLAVAMLDLASRGALKIRRDDEETFTLMRPATGVAALGEVAPASNADVTPGEAALIQALFPGSSTSFTMTSSASTASRMGAAKVALQRSLARDYEKKYFVTNGQTVGIGVGVSLVTQIAASLAAPADPIAVLVMSIFMSVTAFLTYALAVLATNSRIIARIIALFVAIFPVMLAGGVASVAGIGMPIVIGALLATNIAFYHWMKAPTRDGARLLDQIDGFRWYLGVAEKQELDSRYTPESRPEMFARFLPYALALDVEQAWAKRFAEALPPDQFERAQPDWYRSSAMYSGARSSFSAGDFGKTFTSSISSASVAPGSSSGGSSGGSSSSGSGGGGGGGGGGGW